jgi:hypothetical protein
MCAYFNFVKQMLNIDVLILRETIELLLMVRWAAVTTFHLLTIILFIFQYFSHKPKTQDHMEPTLTRMLLNGPQLCLWFLFGSEIQHGYWGLSFLIEWNWLGTSGIEIRRIDSPLQGTTPLKGTYNSCVGGINYTSCPEWVPYFWRMPLSFHVKLLLNSI